MAATEKQLENLRKAREARAAKARTAADEAFANKELASQLAPSPPEAFSIATESAEKTLLRAWIEKSALWSAHGHNPMDMCKLCEEGNHWGVGKCDCPCHETRAMLASHYVI